jgi:signal transduction histidine kinase/CheY-like chemotaxis protein
MALTFGPTLGALILFFVTIWAHHSAADRDMGNALAKHGQVFAPFLWNLERERASQAANIVTQVEGYESIRIEHPTGEVFVASESSHPQNSLERVLRALRLINTTTHVSPLVHHGEEIGSMAVVKVNRDIYFFTVIFSFLALIAFTTHMFMRNLAHKKALAEANLQLETARRKEAEIALVEREKQLSEVRRLENLGRLAGGLAHDFNNILMVVICNADLLKRKMKLDEVNAGLLQGIAEAGERASRLTRQLLSFAARRKSNPIDLCLNDVVQDMHKMLSRMLGDDIELLAKLDPDLLTVRADLSQIEQVVMNLVVNARDAITGGGTITLETRNARGPRGAERDAGKTPGRQVKLVISDDGEGMDEETKQRAFEPFFTTKRTSGTGLGLATVHSIIEQCGGTINIVSEKAKGTTIEISLPSSPKEMALSEGPRVTTSKEAKTDRVARILLAEDQEAIRKVIAEALTEAGYTVVQAVDGNSGLVIALSDPTPFDLLIADVNMPGRSGVELGRLIKSYTPQTKVLCMSGHIDETTQNTPQMPYPFLAKPFTIGELMETIEEQLEPCTAHSRDA